MGDIRGQLYSALQSILTSENTDVEAHSYKRHAMVKSKLNVAIVFVAIGVICLRLSPTHTNNTFGTVEVVWSG